MAQMEQSILEEFDKLHKALKSSTEESRCYFLVGTVLFPLLSSATVSAAINGRWDWVAVAAVVIFALSLLVVKVISWLVRKRNASKREKCEREEMLAILKLIQKHLKLDGQDGG